MAENDAVFDSTDFRGFKPDAVNPWKQKKFDEGGHERDKKDPMHHLRFLQKVKKDDNKTKDYKERTKEKKEENREKRHEYLREYLKKMKE